MRTIEPMRFALIFLLTACGSETVVKMDAADTSFDVVTSFDAAGDVQIDVDRKQKCEGLDCDPNNPWIWRDEAGVGHPCSVIDCPIGFVCVFAGIADGGVATCL